MARPAETYRGARRNAWRDAGCPQWTTIAGDNWQRNFDVTLIKHRPALGKTGDRLRRKEYRMVMKVMAHQAALQRAAAG